MQCHNCQQYHLQVQPTTPTPISYKSFSSQLKDRFSKKIKDESKVSKLTKPSTVHPSPDNLTKTALKDSKQRIASLHVASALTVKRQHGRNRTVSIFDRKMQKVLNKNKERKLKKCCLHYQKTKQDTFNSPEIKENIFRSQSLNTSHSSCIERESLFLEEEIVVLKETPFRRPFNSIELIKKPKVYDTLLDNRCCGMNFCEEGEMILTPQMRLQLLMKMQL